MPQAASQTNLESSAVVVTKGKSRAGRGHQPSVQLLACQHQREVLAFLAARHVHTLIMAGYIRDNGLVSPLHRGAFYACRDAKGRLEGVALIGHLTLIETRTQGALEAFASLARVCPQARKVIAGPGKSARFWRHYARDGERPPLISRELLCELRWPIEVREFVPGLRVATLDDLDLVADVHARMTLEEVGANPMKLDPQGFLERCARRIERERVWVWIENGQLIFKTDIVSETPNAVYLEGVYVAPAERGRGYGLRCFSQLSRTLLERTKSIRLLVSEENLEAQRFYQKVGYKRRGYYDMIFLPQRD